MNIKPVFAVAGLASVLAFFALGSAFSQASAPQTKIAPVIDKNMSATMQLDSIVLGAGCFWGAEKRYEAIPGVVDAVSGYADGTGVKPQYSDITKYKNKRNANNHAEVVKVTFNKSLVNLDVILQNYFEGHDPTQLNRQGNDVGTQYRSTILTNSDQQNVTVNKVSNAYQSLLSEAGYGAIVTKTTPLKTFYPAEDYHQDYLAKNPNGYCPDHSTGVKFNASNNQVAKVDNSGLMQGKHIVVIESESYCPYCEKLKENVLNEYQGSIKVTFRLASQLEGLSVKTPTWATPTVLFLQDGKEVYGKQGYMEPETFYKALGKFKLGKSEAYNVAFNEGTDGRFCQQYEIFKNTPDGTFVDKLSGVSLFDTRDRFNSGTGWLSFTKPVDGAVIEKPDNRFGMRRVEIVSKSSGAHLGHVFDDGPKGQRRFCINATVLDFKVRS
jgi:peptide methionine sulfoxide reductase msrA/msrB